MPSTLVFPEGVRLASREEIPGPESERATAWARIQAANITSGFVLKRAEGERFKCYVEANVDAPMIWTVFHDLCHTLLGSNGALLFGAIDDDPRSIGNADTPTVINALARHKYQLAHDGFIQFGVVSDDDEINEVFVAPTKHLKIWLNDEMRFRSVMELHNVPEVSHLEFLDQYPRTSISLPRDKVVFQDAKELESDLASAVAA